MKTKEKAVNLDRSISELVYRSCTLLDEMDFEGYLDLCAPEFRYRIVEWSPELRKQMVWKDIDKAEMKHHLELVPKHVRDKSALSRFPMVYTISYSDDGKRATVVSGLQVFKTKLDGGETKLFGVGRINDVVAVKGNSVRLLSRELRMETRQFGTGSQIPF
jgi:methanesulfonate monooxygenase small subunit